MTRKEKKELIQKKENWQAFSNLLTRAINDLNRTTKFDEICDVIENFIYLSRQLFKNDEKIDEIIKKLENFLEESHTQMYNFKKKAEPLIQETIDLYNSKYHGDLSFDGDIEKWFNRTFPLIVLYVNRRIKEGDKHDS